MSGRQEVLNWRERCSAEEINNHTRLSPCSNGVIKLLRSLVVLEIFYNVLHPYYPLRFLTTNRSQSPVFLAKFSSMVWMRSRREPHLLSKTDIWWLADQKDSYKCVRWTEKMFFRQAVKL